MHKRTGANKLKKRNERRSSGVIKKNMRNGLLLAGKLFIVLALCCGAVFGARSLWLWINTSPALIVRSIEVRGAVRINPDEIRRLAQIKEGERMLEIKPAAVKKTVMGNRWVKNVHVSRRLPAKVIISVEERTPIALVNVGKIYYVDEEGSLMPLFTATYSDLPLVSGLSVDSTGKKISQSSMKRMQSFIAQADRIDTSMVKKMSQMDFSEESAVRFKTVNSPMIVEIDDSKGAIQLARFGKIMSVLDNSNEGMPRRINLCYSNLGFAQW
ncbi:MAG TPA: hypothetical protein DCO75_00845 [Fibrobacteres bacterium]|nr:hypothetical protein [Fibrobacterota bacterium]